MKRSDAELISLLRDILTGANLKQIAGLTDEGSVSVALIGHPEGANPIDVDANNSDVWVWARMIPGRGYVRGRLFFAGNFLFRLPKAGESCLVVRGGDTGHNGEPYVFYGDVGAQNAVPSWLSSTLSGFYLPEGFKIESTGDQVTLIANSGGTSASMTLRKDGSGALVAAANKNIDVTVSGTGVVNVAGSSHPLPKWDAVETALNTLLGAFNTFLTSLDSQLLLGTAGSPAAQQLVGMAAITVAITNLQTSIATFTGQLGTPAFESAAAKNG